jgi:hypothetical protein
VVSEQRSRIASRIVGRPARSSLRSRLSGAMKPDPLVPERISMSVSMCATWA